MPERTYVDSLVANEFAVEIDGAPVSGVFRVSGFTPYSLDPSPEKTVLITKMVQRDPNHAFNKWLRDSEQQGKSATRSVAIVAIDDGIETRRWILRHAFIMSVSYTDFDSSSVDMIEEMILIGYTDTEHKFTVGG